MKLFTTKEVSALLNISYGTLVRWRANGQGPKHHKIFGSIRYKESDVNKWVKDQKE